MKNAASALRAFLRQASEETNHDPDSEQAERTAEALDAVQDALPQDLWAEVCNAIEAQDLDWLETLAEGLEAL